MMNIFEHKGIRLMQGDCMEFMRSIPDKHYELAIVDPPYGIGECNEKRMLSRHHSQKKYKGKQWDKEPPSIEYFTELFRVSKNQIVWGANHFISRIPYDSSCWIVWDKDTGNSDFADCELAWTSFKSAVRKFTFTWNGFRQGDMKNKEERFHPTQKPVALYKWLLYNYAKQGDKILDTHGGSMSIAIACNDMGFHLDLTELDTEYFEKGVERFKAHIKQAAIQFPTAPKEEVTQTTLF